MHAPDMSSATNGHIHVVEWLLCHGVNTDVTNRYGDTASSMTNQFGFVQIVEMIHRHITETNERHVRECL